MNSFLTKIFLFTWFLIVVIIILIGLSNHLVSKNKYYRLPSETHTVMLGHSHSACAYNDSLFDGIINLSQNTEGYPYSYFKLKKILEVNPQVKNIIVEFANNQLTYWSRDRVYGGYLKINLPRTLPILSNKFILKAIYKSENPFLAIEACILGFKKNLGFLFEKQDDFIENWHDHITPNHVFNGDSIKKVIDFSKNFKNIFQIDDDNLSYLNKIKTLCLEKNVNLLFIRSPLPSHVFEKNKVVFNGVKQTYFSDIPLIDLMEYPMKLNFFADDGHLNQQGRDSISIFLAENVFVEETQNLFYEKTLERLEKLDLLFED